MEKMKKFVALAVAAAMLSSGTVVAQDDNDGVAYYDSYGSTGLAPSIAVGVIAAAAVIAVIINNSNQGAAHTHFHSVSQ